ncbi:MULTISPECIES: nickel/cobalt ABC transporter permease [unclassified Gilliamella]|uniref:nickel/cobalt ABC transporter permease n=1 Tax=unclassified Gilliamella TaxID=2685620 RepID=UPI00226AD4D1|nr:MULTISPECIES: nickel/cobalt ABC transporter permease [unclassified Gilliamella]MCX8596404.1 nickel ABC transporter permease subunit NikC [Gilliamella sp. B3493]MCX8599202.1 nickel ABC transporter permease subunit NikC [Gilliamella sp. B3486]MCX8663639.1 nickel ABC transporter permease subunit NikC [Gilliamella sp. B2911]MCX8689488.1 nickel ABC transporter permease subunit NikC [Gilliamella sp. B2973]MCX8705189.1 nickel ABC transporter permease subunit NikC [Gilliamella sp. B3127]
MNLIKQVISNKTALVCLLIIITIIVLGILAPYIAPFDPNKVRIVRKYAAISSEHWLGCDHLGRDIFSRLLYGIRSTLFLSLLTMIITIIVGSIIGLISGYQRGKLDECIMRLCDIMLSFPSQVMILAIVGVLGVGIENIIIANIVVKWAWYSRMIRSSVIKYSRKNYILFSRAIGAPHSFIIYRHLLPNVMSEVVILATLDTGWVILNISALSFIGLGVQAPTAEWGLMLSEAKNVMTQHPMQMVYPGIAILIVVAAFNMLGDCLRDILDPKEKTA